MTGGTGFIGSNTVASLHGAGHRLRLLARSPERAEELLRSRGLTPADSGIEIVRGDILDRASVRAALAGCEAVVHGAAVVGIDGAKAADALATNETGTRNVLGSAVELGLDPIIFLSSFSALFSPRGPVLLTRQTPVADATSPYAKSKAASERYARELQAKGHPVVCVYPGGVLGPGDPGLSEAMRGAVIWRRLTMIDIDGGFLLVDVRDVAAVITAALTKGRGPRRYLAGHHYLPWSELCDLVSGVTGRRVLRPPFPAGVIRLAGRLGDAAQHVHTFSFPLSQEAMETATEMVPMDDQATTDELGIVFRGPAETLRAAYQWLYDTGHIPARWVPALSRSGGRRQ